MKITNLSVWQGSPPLIYKPNMRNTKEQCPSLQKRPDGLNLFHPINIHKNNPIKAFRCRSLTDAAEPLKNDNALSRVPKFLMIVLWAKGRV